MLLASSRQAINVLNALVKLNQSIVATHNTAYNKQKLKHIIRVHMYKELSQ